MDVDQDGQVVTEVVLVESTTNCTSKWTTINNGSGVSKHKASIDTRKRNLPIGLLVSVCVVVAAQVTEVVEGLLHHLGEC